MYLFQCFNVVNSWLNWFTLKRGNKLVQQSNNLPKTRKQINLWELIIDLWPRYLVFYYSTRHVQGSLNWPVGCHIESHDQQYTTHIILGTFLLSDTFAHWIN